ncbi:MAG: response regulator, partial [Polyangiaceae bacterium]
MPKRPQVLLVEDNAALARTMRWAVLAKCEVTAVGSVREAEECLGGPWDAFIFDISLPDGSGLALMRKARDSHPSAGALVISGLDREGDVEATAEMGARFLAKPFEAADILRFLEECLPHHGGGGGATDGA